MKRISSFIVICCLLLLQMPASADGLKLKTIYVTPLLSSIQINQTAQLNAVAIYEDNSRADVTDQVEWKSTNPAIVTVDSNGMIMGVMPGKAQITAKLDTKTYCASVVVKGATLSKLIPKSPVLNLKVGIQGTNAITGLFSDKSKKDLTKLVVLKANNKNVVIYKNYLIKGMKKGATMITVTYNGLKTTYKVVVK